MARIETTFDKIPIKGHFYIVTVSTLSSFLFVTNYIKTSDKKARITSTTDYTNKRAIGKISYFQSYEPVNIKG